MTAVLRVFSNPKLRRYGPAFYALIRAQQQCAKAAIMVDEARLAEAKLI